MSVSGVGGPGSPRPIDESGERASPAAQPQPAVVRGAGIGRPSPAAAPAPATQPEPRAVYGRWDRFLNGLGGIFGKDRELDQLSEKITSAKERAFGDRQLTRAEFDAVRAEQIRISRAYVDISTRRGYPPGAVLPTKEDAFDVYGENQQIHFQWLAGKDLRGGALADLVKAAGARNPAQMDAVAKKIAFDLATSPDEAIARDKVRLLRAQLSLVPDRASQKAALDKVAASLDQVQASVGATAITRASFDREARFESFASVHETPLPAEVKGNKMFPNRPIPGWEATTRAATKASLDDMHAAGKLFLDKIPPGSGPKTVAMKLDLNLGADGPPSVTDPTTTGATVAELLERAKRDGKEIRFTVGDSSGGENIPLGRTSMDIMRDTGNYHHALKAALKHAAAADNSAPARAALAKVEDAERRGVFFGSKDDKVSKPADLKVAEDAAAKYVKCVDYDKEGFKSVDPKLGPLGLAAWGTREFKIAKPWAEADYRVHVTRGASTHILAGWTGATKGLIGLHAFGLRPVDQGANARGDDGLTGFSMLTQAAGFAGIFQSRTGIKDAAARVAASNDPGLKTEWRKAEAKWSALRENVGAWKLYTDANLALTAELRRDRKAGMSEADVADKMRWRTREILDRADAVAPGFKQNMWDAMHAGTRVMMVAGRNFRGLIPEEVRDEAVGARIGLLTSLPYQSDLVIQTQPKMGEGGGPDAYHKVSDVGVIIAGTDEPTTDALAWKRAGKTENVWGANYPVHASLRYGRGPMHHDEIRDVTHR